MVLEDKTSTCKMNVFIEVVITLLFSNIPEHSHENTYVGVYFE